MTEPTSAENLMPGYPYIGDVSIGPELDGMLFYVESVTNLGPDMGADDTDPDMIALVVEVGAEIWDDILVPADGLAMLVPPTD